MASAGGRSGVFMRTETEHTIFLQDYQPAAYRIERVELEFDIVPETTTEYGGTSP